MKKNLVSVLFVLILCVFNITAEYDVNKHGELSYPTPECKTSYYKKSDGNGFWLIQGFDFEKYNPDKDPCLEEIVTNEINKITSNEATKQKLNNNYVVVGHSQGGPRALAYATMLKEQKPEEFNKLSAVITISGVDRGIKALEGGFGPLKSKLSEDVSIVVKGVSGAFLAFDVTGFSSLLNNNITQSGLISMLLGCTSKSTVDNIITALSVLFSDYDFDFNYFLRGWNNEPYSRIEQLYDMMPGSNFISSKVCETSTKTVKQKIGTTKSYYWTYRKVGVLKVYYLTYKEVPVYFTYTVTTSKAKFDSSLPVGYIVGTDSDTFGLITYNPKKNKIESWKQTAAHAAMNGAGTVMALASAANTAEAVTCGITFNVVGAASHTTAAANCGKASSYFYNINKELNDIKGSSSNDGLVAVESQYIPVGLHTKVLGGSKSGYINISKNHFYSEPAYYVSPTLRRSPQEAKDPEKQAYNIVDSMIKEVDMF